MIKKKYIVKSNKKVLLFIHDQFLLLKQKIIKKISINKILIFIAAFPKISEIGRRKLLINE